MDDISYRPSWGLKGRVKKKNACDLLWPTPLGNGRDVMYVCVKDERSQVFISTGGAGSITQEIVGKAPNLPVDTFLISFFGGFR